MIQPWAIDGSKLTAAQARSEAFKATNGARGVTLPGDLKVSALPTPGGAVAVAPGGATLPNSYLRNGGGQSYGTLMLEEEEVAVPKTTSSGARVSYMIQRIEDPEYGGQIPEDPTTHRYDPFVLVSSLSSINYPWVPLAKITQPANRADIQPDMIEDIRSVTVPLQKSEMRTFALLSGDRDELKSTGGGDGMRTGGTTWPVATEDAWGTIPIPEWATRMKIVMWWSGVRSPGESARGSVWVQVGMSVNEDKVITQVARYDAPTNAGVSRISIAVADVKPIPVGLRGTSQKFYPRGNRDSGLTSDQFLQLDGGSVMILQVEFQQVAD